MTHYNITRGRTPDQFPRLIADAYKAAGMEPPNRSSELRERLAAEPTAAEVAQRLAVESLTVADLDAWFPKAVDEIARAHASDELALALTRYREKALKDEGGRMMAEALADLQAPFKTAAKKLEKLAKALPSGPNAFDLEAIVATDTTKQAREAGETLQLLSAFADVVGFVGSASIHPQAREVLLVVDVPEVPINYINRLTRAELEPSEDRENIRALLNSAQNEGADTAIVRVARAEFGDNIRLSLVTSRNEARERDNRAQRATSVQPTDTGPGPRNRASGMKVTL